MENNYSVSHGIVAKLTSASEFSDAEDLAKQYGGPIYKQRTRYSRLPTFHTVYDFLRFFEASLFSCSEFQSCSVSVSGLTLKRSSYKCFALLVSSVFAGYSGLMIALKLDYCHSLLVLITKLDMMMLQTFGYYCSCGYI